MHDAFCDFFTCTDTCNPGSISWCEYDPPLCTPFVVSAVPTDPSLPISETNPLSTEPISVHLPADFIDRANAPYSAGLGLTTAAIVYPIGVPLDPDDHVSGFGLTASDTYTTFPTITMPLTVPTGVLDSPYISVAGQTGLTASASVGASITITEPALAAPGVTLVTRYWFTDYEDADSFHTYDPSSPPVVPDDLDDGELEICAYVLPSGTSDLSSIGLASLAASSTTCMSITVGGSFLGADLLELASAGTAGSLSLAAAAKLDPSFAAAQRAGYSPSLPAVFVALDQLRSDLHDSAATGFSLIASASNAAFDDPGLLALAYTVTNTSAILTGCPDVTIPYCFCPELLASLPDGTVTGAELDVAFEIDISTSALSSNHVSVFSVTAAGYVLDCDAAAAEGLFIVPSALAATLQIVVYRVSYPLLSLPTLAYADVSLEYPADSWAFEAAAAGAEVPPSGFLGFLSELYADAAAPKPLWSITFDDLLTVAASAASSFASLSTSEALVELDLLAIVATVFALLLLVVCVLLAIITAVKLGITRLWLYVERRYALKNHAHLSSQVAFFKPLLALRPPNRPGKHPSVPSLSPDALKASGLTDEQVADVYVSEARPAHGVSGRVVATVTGAFDESESHRMRAAQAAAREAQRLIVERAVLIKRQLSVSMASHD
jgi:hypothetical protein